LQTETTCDSPILLGVDCGTESIRVLAVDPSGNLVADARIPHRTTHLHTGWAEQSPADWWDGLVRAIAELHLSRSDLTRIAAIGVAATSSTVVFSTAEGEPVRPAMLWMDVRATAEASRIEYTGHPVLALCPDGVSPEWGPAKAGWVSKHESDRFTATDVVCEGGDWLIHQLTGEWSANVPAAATAWFFDAVSSRWPDDLYRASGLPELTGKCPSRVLRPGEIAGSLLAEIAAHLGLNPGIPVVEGGIDSISAMLAMGVTGDGPAALITGSSNVILAQSSASVRAKGVWGGYRDAATPGFDLVVGLHNAGTTLAWLTRTLLEGRVTLEQLESEAMEIAPGSHGLIALPDFQGNRTPFTEPLARGALWGLTLGHGPAHIYRAMLEGIGFATRHALDAITDAGVVVTELRACGGATRSELTMQVYADILGRPVVTTHTADASALGAAISASIGIGLYSDFPKASKRMNRSGRVFTPDPEHRERYDALYDLFRRTYPALLPLMRAMANVP